MQVNNKVKKNQTCGHFIFKYSAVALVAIGSIVLEQLSYDTTIVSKLRKIPEEVLL